MTEGALTEQDYLDYLRQELRQANLSIRPAHDGSDPLKVVETAIRLRDEAAQQARHHRDASLRFEGVWGLVDVDQHPTLSEARDLARRERIALAVTNPCFELWCLIHFADQAAQLQCAEAKRRLRTHIPGYDKGLDDCRQLRGRYGEARERARRLEGLHERNGTSPYDPHGQPSSEVHRLVEALLGAARRSARDPAQVGHRL